MVAVHLSFNFRVVVGYLTSASSPVDRRRSTAPAYGRLLLVLLVALYGCVCYLLGFRQGTEVIKVNEASHPSRSLAPVGAAQPRWIDLASTACGRWRDHILARAPTQNGNRIPLSLSFSKRRAENS
jgi:hypothetical protein